MYSYQRIISTGYVTSFSTFYSMIYQNPCSMHEVLTSVMIIGRELIQRCIVFEKAHTCLV